MAHHTPFKALCPVEWATVADGNLPEFLRETFSHAQTLIDSIPLPQSVANAAGTTLSSSSGRARSSTDPSAGGSVVLNRTLSPADAAGPVQGCAATAKLLHKEWKEVKINPRDNPLAINVHKLTGRDGKGAWFARRSIHHNITFDKFRLGLEREFAEALRAREALNAKGGNGGEPGAGKVRGIGAERRVERAAVEGLGKAEVYQLSAQFPGPTAPRDFITLLLTSSVPDDAGSGGRRPSPVPRQYMVVSKPCIHADCPLRQGYIRGQYESVEIIREVPIEVPLRKVRSSIDITREDSADMSKSGQVALGREAVLRSARRAGAAINGADSNGSDDDDDDDDNDRRSTHSDMGALKSGSSRAGGSGHAGIEMDTAIEWLMVTRSDPGGSVPRFMIEKGTPNGIVSDAAKLLDWLASKDPNDFAESEYNDYKEKAVLAAVAEEPAPANEVDREPAEPAPQPEKKGQVEKSGDGGAPRRRAVASSDVKTSGPRRAPRKAPPTQNLVPNREAVVNDAPPTGFYGMIAGALGAAGSVVTSRLPLPFQNSSARATDSDPDLDRRYDDYSDSSDTSSIRSFSSAVESAHPQDRSEESAASPDQPRGGDGGGGGGGSGEPDAPTSMGTATATSTWRAEVPPPVDAAPSIASRDSSTSHASRAVSSSLAVTVTQNEKELRKIEERQRKAHEKMEKTLARRNEERQRDEAAAAKLREKHERELARQEAKYQRELRKMEERRLHEARKAEERRRKLAEREDRASLVMELERARGERDLALKQMEVLKDQVGELQSQNTALVATLGRHGLLKGGGPDVWKELQHGGGKSGGTNSSAASLLQPQSLDDNKSSDGSSLKMKS